ncbi:hypothetical protein L596_001942 [Steinernema carpocapsae]|uniref:Nucleotide-diphospho-sugar transferase domain-containing protein n=1 Tax=Steinernema carpocapsae TaxID=34508 RepID=A0A4U8URN1_STECR|nr:hypothetical protein L596_001942 [Steinernema carpocapsae]
MTYFKKHCAAAVYLKDTDWMLVLDADTAVVNPNHCLEEYIDDRVDMVFYERFFNWEIACGNYFIKNTAQSRRFLMEYANMENEPYNPGVWLGFDNGPLQLLIMKYVMPFAKHMIEVCNNMWHSSKSYDEYTAYLLCVKMALGEQRLWPGKLRIYKRAHSWVRDGWLTSNHWTDNDFMLHGWKIEDLKNATNFNNPFTQDFTVSECGRGYSGWNYKPGMKKTAEEIKKLLFDFEKNQQVNHPKQGRTPYFLTGPDIGDCYPFCEDF